jgi:hypothetical protein
MHHLRSSIQYFNKWGWLNDRYRMTINRSLARNYFFTPPLDLVMPGKQTAMLNTMYVVKGEKVQSEELETTV